MGRCGMSEGGGWAVRGLEGGGRVVGSGRESSWCCGAVVVGRRCIEMER
jgi:hypothetical protein